MVEARSAFYVKQTHIDIRNFGGGQPLLKTSDKKPSEGFRVEKYRYFLRLW